MTLRLSQALALVDAASEEVVRSFVKTVLHDDDLLAQRFMRMVGKLSCEDLRADMLDRFARIVRGVLRCHAGCESCCESYCAPGCEDASYEAAHLLDMRLADAVRDNLERCAAAHDERLALAACICASEFLIVLDALPPDAELPLTIAQIRTHLMSVCRSVTDLEPSIQALTKLYNALPISKCAQDDVAAYIVSLRSCIQEALVCVLLRDEVPSDEAPGDEIPCDGVPGDGVSGDNPSGDEPPGSVKKSTEQVGEYAIVHPIVTSAIEHVYAQELKVRERLHALSLRACDARPCGTGPRAPCRTSLDIQTCKARLYELEGRRAHWVAVAAMLLLAQGVSSERVEQYAGALVGHEVVCTSLCDDARVQNNESAALRILQHAKACAIKTWGAYSPAIAQRLSDTLDETDTATQGEELLYLLGISKGRRTSRSTEALWMRLRGLYTAHEWASVYTTLLARIDDPWVRAQCFAAEGNFDQVMYEAEHNDIRIAEKYEHELAHECPGRLLTLYLCELKRRKDVPGYSRAEYRALAQRLKHLKSLPGGYGAVEDFIWDLRMRYPRRRALLDELACI